MSPSILKLGVAPSVEEIDAWMLEWGMTRSIVGTSFQGRDLVVYESTMISGVVAKNADSARAPTILFLSLSHGNEPMGLLSLLMSVPTILRWRTSPTVRGSRNDAPIHAPRLIFFPIVNVDAYTLNRDQGHGTIRSNLRIACSDGNGLSDPRKDNAGCSSSHEGVDLNRNYKTSIIDVEERYGGHYPFSEPETQAVRHVVEHFNVTHAMSFHSMQKKSRPRLLIHPYTSTRSFKEMPSDRAEIYRTWSAILNSDGDYKRGTATETIGYTASGSSIDWMEESKDVFAFVVETVPPCAERWCENKKRVLQEARINARAANRFVQLATYGHLVDDDITSLRRFGIIAFAIGLAYYLLRRNHHALQFFIRRCSRRKEKQVLEHETELQILAIDH